MTTERQAPTRPSRRVDVVHTLIVLTLFALGAWFILANPSEKGSGPFYVAAMATYCTIGIVAIWRGPRTTG